MNQSRKEKAIERVKERFTKKHSVHNARKSELLQRQSDVRELLGTRGWKVLTESLSKQIENKKEKLINVNSFRVFTCMKLKSELQALCRLHNMMLTEELSNLVITVKEQ